MTIDVKITPMMAQWQTCKDEAKDALLFFRMGDFYEAFYDDAEILSKEIDLTLTKRQGIPMAGIPFHTLDGYLDKLIQKGFKVAIAEQTEDPKAAKGLVKREIVRIVTPGTLLSSSLLNEKSNNYFVSLAQIGSLFGLSFVDISTGEFKAIECDNIGAILGEIYHLRPSEFLVSSKFLERHKKLFEEMKLAFSFLITDQEDWLFDHQMANTTLVEHFQVQSLDSYGLKGMNAAINAAGALLSYLRDTLSLPIHHLHSICTYSTSDFVLIDRTTRANLELTESLREGSRKHTLLEVLDVTGTPMGARLLKHWILQPLLLLEDIHARQDAIEELLSKSFKLQELTHILPSIKDLERLMMKVSSGYAGPRDLFALRLSLENTPALKTALTAFTSTLISEECKKLYDLTNITELLKRAIKENPPLRINEGGIFNEGYNEDLDALRKIKDHGTAWLANYQVQLREQTQIKTLKVSFTSAFGYYIEVSKGQADRMPTSFQRRQTLVNSERFISPELKEYEEKVLGAEERMLKMETELFTELRLKVAAVQDKVWEMARSIAVIDSLTSLASVARKHGYTRPLIDNSSTLLIEEGRHPVIEASLLHRNFTPNDTLLDDTANKLILLTGPNMAGKSTYIRQVALITLMAHMGSFVPAKKAHIGCVDKIFTRIGASDDLSRGQSTFMVEMSETANILHHATSKSLVILDEIGRGTSTYDGIAIAWSVAEYLLTKAKAKTLFATHYWELTQLEKRIPGAKNYNVAVQETHEGIFFLHKIVQGGTDKSYGIHVAKLAGLPAIVIERAKEILTHLEDGPSGKKEKKKQAQDSFQMLLFG